MKDRQNNSQRTDEIWNRWMMDKIFKQTAGKKRTEMMRAVKDGRQTKISEGRKQTKFQTGKTERGTEQAKFQRAQKTHTDRKQKAYGQYFRVCGQITVGSPARKGNRQRSIN
jgi:hypothetical protein